jgi:hypothetical protein
MKNQAAVQAIRLASRHWPRTPRGQKVACPDCGQTGYVPYGNPKRWWTDRHVEHSTAQCGRVFTTIGLALHKHSCAICNATTERQLP